jgi:REP element-mobilizing transposase RayT
MARRPRLLYPGAIYHVMSRGNRKAPIFDDDADRVRFFETLETAGDRYGARIHEVCQMTNHYHLLLATPRGNLSGFMQYLNGVFAQRSNRRHGRSGHLFEGRFRSIVVQRDSYFRRVSKYIVLNPVRARLVSDVAAWTWSTYRATAGLEDPPSWLDCEWIGHAFGGRSHAESQERYQQWVNAPRRPMRGRELEGAVYGTRGFERNVLEEARRARADQLLPSSWGARARPTLGELFRGIGACPGRRNTAIREAHVSHGYNMVQIGSFLQLDRSTVSKVIRSLEDSVR